MQRNRMSEETSETIQEEVAEPQAEDTHEQPQEPKAPKVDQDQNWRQVQEVLKSQKQQIEELQQKLHSQHQVQNAPVPVEEPDEFADLDPEDIITVSKARHMASKIAQKEAKKAAKEMVEQYVGKYSQEQRVASDEQRMRSQADDYDYVMENFAFPLIKNDPALARMIQNSKNPAEKAYNLAKLSDAYEHQNKPQHKPPSVDKVLKNAARPTSSNAVGNLKSQAAEFSNLDASKVWEMSQKFARGG